MPLTSLSPSNGVGETMVTTKDLIQGKFLVCPYGATVETWQFKMVDNEEEDPSVSVDI